MDKTKRYLSVAFVVVLAIVIVVSKGGKTKCVKTYW